MPKPWQGNHPLRDFALAGHINNISDLRRNLIRDSALVLPAPPAAGRAAEYPYYHGVELYLHSSFSRMIGRRNAISAVRYQFSKIGEELRRELEQLPDQEREDLHEQARKIVPGQYSLGLVCLGRNALGPKWVSRELRDPTNIGVVADSGATFTIGIDAETKAAELVAHVASQIRTPVLGVTVINLTQLMVAFDEALDRRGQWNSAGFPSATGPYDEQ